MQIALIGAGLMGFGMAANLLKHGHKVNVIAHRNRAPVEALVARGASEKTSLKALADNADIIILCVTTSKVVEETIAALKPFLKSGQIILDAGTSLPASSRALARDLDAIGVGFADVPMTGGPEQAEKGKLGILCGATEEVFAKIEPVLSCYATTIRHFGPPGAGHTAKIISNFLVTGMITLVSEAFATARKADIDWADLYSVMLNGSGNSGVLRKMVEPALAGNFDGYRFSLANAAKDIGYYRAMAEELGCGGPMPKTIAERFAEALETADGNLNVSRLLDPAFKK